MIEMMRDGEFEPGPLWFAEPLLIFAVGYVICHRLHPASTHVSKLPSFGVLLSTAIVLGVINFVVRLVVPVGESVLWLQLGYFPCYIYLFAAGCAAAETRLLEKITLKEARPWLWVSLVTVLTMPLMLIFGEGHGAFEGGWSWNALTYALWDPFVAWGVILGLLVLARTRWSQGNLFTAWLAENAYGAYIVHPPVVVGLSVWAVYWPIAPPAKFFIVGSLAVAGSMIIASIVRAIPGVKRVV